MAPILLAPVLAFLVAAVATRAVRGAALKRGHVDHPDERKRHARAVPRLGGVGIAAGVVVGLAVAALTGTVAGADVLPLLVGGGVLVALGVWDDLAGIGFKRRFVVQTAVAYGLVLAGWHLDLTNLWLFGSLAPFTQAALVLPVTMLWLVGLVNAMNLLDGLDGLVSGVSVIAFAALALACPGDPVLLALCAAGAASALGFLVYNRHPASIFMGDTGSTLLGFLLAAAGLRCAMGAPTPGILAVPVVILGLPLLDTVTTMARRTVHGHSPFLPDADHIHHRVLERNHGRVRQAVRAVWGAAAVFGALGVALSRARGSDWVQVACLLAAVSFAYLVVRHLRYVRVRVVWRKMQQRTLHRRHARLVAEAPASAQRPTPQRTPAGGDGTAQRHPPTVTVGR